MRLSRFGLLPLLALWPTLAFAAKPKPCVPAEQAAEMLNQDICISAHVYEIVELESGAQFLDVCPPDTPDEKCGFTIVSQPEDRDTVGELRKYRNSDVHIRGRVQHMNGRLGMVLSHSRQFSGGPPKFKPNPLLARGFNADVKRGPVRAPDLARQPRPRSFMNSRIQEALPAN